MREFVVEALGGCVLECDHTRRNAPDVLGALNAVFDEAQAARRVRAASAPTPPRSADAGAPALLALPPVLRPPAAPRAAAAAEPAPWRDSLTQPRHEPEEVLREQEARRVAAAMPQLLAQRRRGRGDMMVLCRKRASLRLVAQALQAAARAASWRSTKPR